MKFTGYVLVGFLTAMSLPAAENTDRSSNSEMPVIHRMRRVSVDSEAIASIGYHRKTRTLEVRFRSTETYRYAKVPPQVFQEFIASESKGHYFQRQIRGRYTYWKMKK
ncbi:MAG: KTSC domain-containing protein [Bryobacteraceae bacterium]|nr:KTSC domain-containing protein [Bryobacteraceae bacterium]